MPSRRTESKELLSTLGLPDDGEKHPKTVSPEGPFVVLLWN